MKVIQKPVKIRFKLKRGGTVSFKAIRTMSKPEKDKFDFTKLLHTRYERKPVFELSRFQRSMYMTRLFKRQYLLDRIPCRMIELKKEYGHCEYGNGWRYRLIFKKYYLNLFPAGTLDTRH
jgi:hypothetical protein